jgi:hypothetical protein
MQQPFNQATPAPPTTEDINRIWRTDRCLQESSAKVYLQWIRRFRAYLVRHKLNECAELTLEGARRFFVWYARRRHLTGLRVSKAGAALHALSRVYACRCGTSRGLRGRPHRRFCESMRLILTVIAVTLP